MVSRFAAFVIWAAVAGSVVYWALQLGSRPIATPAHAELVSMAGGFNGELSRVLGDDDAPAAAPTGAAPVQSDARFRLVGVVAPRVPGARPEGVALIATDGKPAKAYRVGSVVDGELVLQAVRTRGASLGPRGEQAQVDLQLPALAPPASGAPPRPGALSPQTMPPMPQAVPPFPRQRESVPLPTAPMPDDGEPEAPPGVEPPAPPAVEPTLPQQRQPFNPLRPPT